ncbi:MAG: hypothetical protein ACRDV4_04725, partial [Acidimicrobiales bacterium]
GDIRLPLRASPRGIGRLTDILERHFQVLWHGVRLKTDDPTVFRLFGLIDQRARHSTEALAETHITALGSPEGGFRIFDRADFLQGTATPEEVLDCVFTRVYRRAAELASLRGWLRVHGAVVGLEHHRVVVIGPASAGKTTLVLGLLAEGAAAEVDESFVARRNEVVGVARRFHVQPGSVEILERCPWLRDAPALGPDPVRFVDPTEHGFEWEIPIGPVEHVVVLRRTDGPSRLEPAPTSAVVQEVISQAFPVLEPRRAIVRQASALATSAGCHLLHAGPDLKAPAMLMSLVRR